MEKRGGALIDMDRAALEARMRTYHDKDLDWDAYRLASSVLTEDRARFDARKARARAVNQGFQLNQIVRYAVRPFDTRWCYYTGERPIWNEPRPSLWAQCFEGNRFLSPRPAGVANPEGFPFMFTAALGDNDAIRGHAYYFPLKLKKGHAETHKGHLFAKEKTELNCSAMSKSYLSEIGATTTQDPEPKLWFHTLAIGYSPAYLKENADGIRGDWPRIPLPASLEQFQISAALGRQVADLLDTEHLVPGVTAGALRTELRGIAALARIDGKPVGPGEDFMVTAGWGHAGKDGVTMPGRGKLVQRERTQKEHAELVQGIAALGLSEEAAIACLGASVVDVSLNDRCAWTGIPEKVWELYIGGYQVIKKWLSYREHSILGRALTLGEVEEVQAMARRLTALCLLQPQLDANYHAVAGKAWHSPRLLS
jgi:hypothetical protein